MIVIGLTKYYTNDTEVRSYRKDTVQVTDSSLFNIAFLSIYAVSIIFALISSTNADIYVSFDELSSTSILHLILAIFISFFAPGYAALRILIRECSLGFIPLLLSSYLISLFFTGMITFATSIADVNMQFLPYYLAAANSVLLALFTAYKFRKQHFNLNFSIERRLFGKSMRYKMIVFGAMLFITIISTYVLYHGIIIGDQWYYHGKALLTLSGNFRELAESDIDIDRYPPFSMSFLAAFFSISDVPSVNAYASLGLLNFFPVLSFYYFFRLWVPVKYKRSGLIAAVLFMLSSGLGWLYAFYLAVPNQPLSDDSALSIITTAGEKTIDIFTPNTFVNGSNPDISTALVTSSVPAGFFLLGLLKENSIRSSRYCVIIIIVTLLGLLSHDEFGLFVIIVALVPVLFSLNNKHQVYLGLVLALTILIAISILVPGLDHYYLSRGIISVPFIFLYCTFVVFAWAIYHFHVFEHLIGTLKNAVSRLQYRMPVIKSSRVKIGVAILVSFLVVYLYSLSLSTWYFELPNFQLSQHTSDLTHIPAYLYPLRLGIPGIIGTAFLLSYLFRKFEKELFIFGLIGLIAYIILPQFMEFRSNRYIMASFDAYTAILLYQVFLIFSRKLKRKVVLNSLIIGGVIVLSSLSTFMYVGSTALGLLNPDNELFSGQLPRRVFPTVDDLQALRFISENIDVKRDQGIVYLSDGNRLEGIIPQLEGFTGLPSNKITQSSLTLHESSLEGFYTLLNHTNAKYIMIDRDDLEAISAPILFTLIHFEIAFENEKILILSVPDNLPPRPDSDIAMIDVGTEDVVTTRSSLIPNSNISSIETLSHEELTRLNSNQSFILKPQSQIRFNTTGENINYLESTFRIRDRLNETDNHAGLLWSVDNKTNLVFVRSTHMTFLSSDSPELDRAYDIETVPIEPVGEGDTITLKVLYANGMTSIFLDGILRMQITSDDSNSDGEITVVGVESWNTITEFLLPETGVALVPDTPYRYGKFHNYDYYYALSGLGLSGIKYETFSSSDNTWEGKSYVILPTDVVNSKPYQDYASGGGTLVVFSNQLDQGGNLSKLLCLNPLSAQGFDSIVDTKKQKLLMDGIARDISITCGGSVVDSFYSKNGIKVAPFIIEKNFGKGKVIFVNSEGFFDSILTHDQGYFPNLSLVGDFLNLPSLYDGKDMKDIHMRNDPLPYFLGGGNFSGDVTLQSSSALDVNQIEAANLTIKTQFDNSPLSFSNASIRNLQFSGDYLIRADMPSLYYTPSSDLFSYVTFTLPKGTDLFITPKGSSSAIFDLFGDSHNILNASIGIWNTSMALQLTMKYPIVKLDGNMTLEVARSHYPDQLTNQMVYLGELQLTEGNTSFRFNHINFYDRQGFLGLTSYFDWIYLDTNKTEVTDKIDVMSEELTIEWDQILTSYYGTRMLFLIVVAGLLLSYFMHQYPKLRKLIGL